MIYCLDTDILNKYFRGNEAVKKRIAGLREDDSVGLTWLSVAVSKINVFGTAQ